MRQPAAAGIPSSSRNASLLKLCPLSSKNATKDSVKTSRICLIGAGSGGGNPNEILEMIQDELDTIDFDGEVVIVRYRKKSR